MDCISAKPLTDSELLQFQDGESEPAVGEHLENCLYCQQRQKVLFDVQNNLRQNLYRHQCPSPQDLGEFHLRLLPPENLSLIEAHLIDCLHCTRELQDLKGYLHQLESDLATSPFERAKILVAKLIGGLEGSGTNAFSPSMVAVRGDNSLARMYDASDFQVTIELQTDPDNPGIVTILGLALGVNVGDFSARLFHEGAEIGSIHLDELGNFVFNEVPTGSYDLILQGPETEIHIPSIAV